MYVQVLNVSSIRMSVQVMLVAMELLVLTALTALNASVGRDIQVSRLNSFKCICKPGYTGDSISSHL